MRASSIPSELASIDSASVLYVTKLAVAFVASWWLQIPWSVQTLVICMALDFATGLLVAFITESVSSKRSSVGLARKAMILIMVAVAHIIGEAIKLPFDLGVVVAVAYIINEIISITENCANAGVPIPPAVLSILLKAKGMTGRNVDRAKVVEELEATVVSQPDGLGGTQSVISSKKTLTGTPDALREAVAVAKATDAASAVEKIKDLV